jgi:ankyrin repeat protein
MEEPVTANRLHEAVAASDDQTAVWLLRAGVPADVTAADGRTPLMVALENRDPAMALTLLEQGADPHAVDESGGSVLYHAVRHGEVAVVKELLDRGVRGDGETPEGGSLLGFAVAEGRTASARMLLESGARHDARCDEGRPVAFHALERNADWLLDDILRSGADVNARDVQGETLVLAAVRRGARQHLPILWKHGADANATNAEGVAPIHLAIAAGGAGMVTNLHERGAVLGLRHPEEGAPVLMAVERRDHEVLRELLSLGANPLVVAKDGRSALELALDRRDFSAGQLLAEHGATPKGMLYDAVRAQDRELVEFLLARGADPSPEGAESPLVAAVQADDPAMALALLKAGAKVPKGKVFAGQSLFHLALVRGHREVVQELLKNGAEVNEAFAEPVQEDFLNAVTSQGKIKWFLKRDRRVTPLMAAADSGDLAMVRMLLEYGASKNTSTRRHRFWPINFASQRGDVPMMQLMLGRDPEQEERWVKVDLSEQKAWVYNMKNEVLFETRVSTGKTGYETRTGSFVISNKYRHWTSTIYRGASMPYFQRLSCGDFGFHRGYVPSYPASHGCLRVPSGNAYKLYKATEVGDRVEIVE